MNVWQIYAAVALRRLPVIVPKMDPIEARVQEIFNAYEVAKSKLSDFEMERLEEIKIESQEDAPVMIKETTLDRTDKWNKEKSQFKFAEYNDRLAYTQYLIMKQKFGPTDDNLNRWLLPQTIYDARLDSNLLDTARRALKERLNIVNGFKVIGKVPASVHQFSYPKKIAQLTGFKGAKVFFMRATMDDRPSASVLEALDDTKNDKLKWITRDEATELLQKDYLRGLDQGILDEKRVDIDLILARAVRSASAITTQQDSKERQQQQ